MFKPVTVRSVSLDGFIGHTDTLLSLPATGVVAIIGDNGSGKSTLINAVSWGLYGTMLTGKRYVPTRPMSVFVSLGSLSVERARDQRRSLARVFDGGVEHSFDTASQCNEWLGAVIPPFELWALSCVFTTRAMNRFGALSDLGRKELIETALRMTAFDNAFARATDEHKAAVEQLRFAEGSLATARAVVERQREARAKAIAASNERIASLAAECDRLSDVHRAAEDRRIAAALRLKQREAELASASEVLNEADERCETAKRAVLELRANKCSSCGQLRVRNEHELAAMLRTAEAQLEAEGTMRVPLAARVALARTALAQALSELRDAESAQKHTYVAVQFARRDLAAVRDAPAASEVDEHLVADAERELAKAKHEANLAHAVRTVLGPKGARALLLRDALSVLERTANSVLSELGTSIQVELAADEDAVGPRTKLSVRGAGGGEYDSCSAGETRRIDLALAYALGELSSTSVRAPNTQTLFLDEVFDALDAQGCVYAAQWIARIAKERCVVVITHNEQLLSYLNARVARITNGVLEWQ